VVARNGRYGPYVSHAGVNATLPRDKSPDTVTLDEAVALIDAKAESRGGRPSARRAPGKTAARKRTAAKSSSEKPKPQRKVKKAAK
jgi:DNA topoisomerase I